MHLAAQRRAPVLPQTEADLLLKLNQPFDCAQGDISTSMPEMQARCETLIAKRQAETLTPSEYDELLQLTEHFEALNAQRLEALVALARMRDVSLSLKSL